MNECKREALFKSFDLCCKKLNTRRRFPLVTLFDLEIELWLYNRNIIENLSYLVIFRVETDLNNLCEYYSRNNVHCDHSNFLTIAPTLFFITRIMFQIFMTFMIDKLDLSHQT